MLFNVTAGLENRLGVNMVLINPILGLAMEKMDSDSAFCSGARIREGWVGVYWKRLPGGAYIRKKIVMYNYLRLGRWNIREWSKCYIGSQCGKKKRFLIFLFRSQMVFFLFVRMYPPAKLGQGSGHNEKQIAGLYIGKYRSISFWV